LFAAPLSRVSSAGQTIALSRAWPADRFSFLVFFEPFPWVRPVTVFVLVDALFFLRSRFVLEILWRALSGKFHCLIILLEGGFVFTVGGFVRAGDGCWLVYQVVF